MSNDLSRLKVRDLGEQALLQRLQRFCPKGIVGDDAAVLQTRPQLDLVITTDVLVDGVHFSVGLATPNIYTTSPADVGWRAAAANLSDLAAMGAAPLGITVGLSAPGETPVVWIEEIYQGLTACLQRFNTPIVGGDITRSPILTLAITAFGQVAPHQVIRRSTAQPGDAIVATGWHGASRAGLELLLHPELGQELSESDRTYLIQSHQRPNPRLDILPYLLPSSPIPHPSSLLSPPFKIAGMDSSDGLADAIVQICRMSSVGARVERSQIPIPPALTRWVSSEQAMQWALYGGEDFELVLCLEQAAAQALVEQLGLGAAIVGTITKEPEVLLVDAAGHEPDETLTLQKGFQHF
ncbi:thiamine-phosphate kinase [Trichocoleus desertorum AS-A10]|uniref:thiamine-phosphate kinase n=1 Tax=Trichocoleus desertorum TaxID=1481672 RepID=UPI0032993A20